MNWKYVSNRREAKQNQHRKMNPAIPWFDDVGLKKEDTNCWVETTTQTIVFCELKKHNIVFKVVYS